MANVTDKNWNNPIGVAVALIPVRHEGMIGLLGVQRNIEPCKHGVALPGGYINELETAKIAVAREVFEETSLKLNVSDFSLTDEAITQQNRHLIFLTYNKTLDSKDIHWNFECDETESLVFIGKETEICFPTHKDMINQFFLDEAVKDLGYPEN